MGTRFDVNHIVLYVHLNLPTEVISWGIIRRVVVALMEEV